MARHLHRRTPPGAGQLIRRGVIIAAAAVVSVAVAGCGASDIATRCPPVGIPVELSDSRRVDPVVATNGGTDAVAAWQTSTGAPVEVRTRHAAGQWEPVRAIGGRNSRDPSVAMTAEGDALVALQTYDDSHRARIGVASERGDWAIRHISPERSTARTPSIAVDAAGRAIAVWQADRSATSTEIQLAERSADGTWSTARTVSHTSRVGTPTLAMAADGSAVVAWPDESGKKPQIWATVRTPDGQWTDPEPLSPSGRRAVTPGVAALHEGIAAVGWVESDAANRGPVVVTIARHDAEGWGTPTIIDEADEAPREMSRPGRAEMSPGLVFAPDGRLTISWATGRNDITEVSTASVDAEGRPGPVRLLSNPREQAGGVSVARSTGGAVVTGWEEIDGGLLRVRAQVDERACRDVAPPTGESASIRIGGGTAPVAVYLDLNRSRVMAVDLT